MNQVGDGGLRAEHLEEPDLRQAQEAIFVNFTQVRDYEGLPQTLLRLVQ